MGLLTGQWMTLGLLLYANCHSLHVKLAFIREQGRGSCREAGKRSATAYLEIPWTRQKSLQTSCLPPAGQGWGEQSPCLSLEMQPCNLSCKMATLIKLALLQPGVGGLFTLQYGRRLCGQKIQHYPPGEEIFPKRCSSVEWEQKEPVEMRTVLVGINTSQLYPVVL